MMRTRRVVSLWVAVLTAAVVFVLIVWGGIVHNTGSALGCPDWPLCYGQVVVNTSGMSEQKAAEVFWEHTHRVLGTLAGLCSIALVILLWKPLENRRPLRARAILLLDLIILQGVLGGITVLLNLPPMIATAHLALSLIILGLLIQIIFRIKTPEPAEHGPEILLRLTASSYLIGIAMAVVYFQTILGGLVRHTGSSTAAGVGWSAALVGIDINTRQYSLWPSFHPALLNMLHRYAGLLVLCLIVITIYRLGKLWAGLPTRPRRWLTTAPVVLVAAQVLIGVTMLGVWMLSTPVINWRIVLQTLHLAVPTVLLANLYLLYLMMRHPTALMGSGPAVEAKVLSPES